jgi:hypothetical protein
MGNPYIIYRLKIVGVKYKNNLRADAIELNWKNNKIKVKKNKKIKQHQFRKKNRSKLLNLI